MILPQDSVRSGSTSASSFKGFASDDLVSTMYWVQQYIMDYTYTAANVVLYEALLDGFKFDCSAVFPGSVAPPTVVTHTATIDASYPDTARLGKTRR